jgi:hypothetical protein
LIGRNRSGRMINSRTSDILSGAGCSEVSTFQLVSRDRLLSRGDDNAGHSCQSVRTPSKAASESNGELGEGTIEIQNVSRTDSMAFARLLVLKDSGRQSV